MTLNASGQISLGGSTTGESVNLELGFSATAQISFNDVAVRNLTGTANSAALVMPNDFYGKSSTLDTQTVTTGAIGSALNQDRERGYSSGGYGSISDGTSNIYSGGIITNINWFEGGGGGATYELGINGASVNGGWTTMTIGTKALSRAAASYTYTGGLGYWVWTTTDNVSAQAFSTAGTVVTVTFT